MLQLQPSIDDPLFDFHSMRIVASFWKYTLQKGESASGQSVFTSNGPSVIAFIFSDVPSDFVT